MQMLESQKTTDVLYAISQGVKADLEERFPIFSYSTQARRIKGQGHRIELVAKREDADGFQTLAFKIYFTGQNLELCDDGFDIDEGHFNRSVDFHTFSEFEYADPNTLDRLYEEIEKRFI